MQHIASFHYSPGDHACNMLPLNHTSDEYMCVCVRTCVLDIMCMFIYVGAFDAYPKNMCVQVTLWVEKGPTKMYYYIYY